MFANHGFWRDASYWRGHWGSTERRTSPPRGELGVNFIDTADYYGPYMNEELIAEALFPYPEGLVIATKGGWERPGPNQWTHSNSVLSSCSLQTGFLAAPSLMRHTTIVAIDPSL